MASVHGQAILFIIVIIMTRIIVIIVTITTMVWCDRQCFISYYGMKQHHTRFEEQDVVVHGCWDCCAFVCLLDERRYWAQPPPLLAPMASACPIKFCPSVSTVNCLWFSTSRASKSIPKMNHQQTHEIKPRK